MLMKLHAFGAPVLRSTHKQVFRLCEHSHYDLSGIDGLSRCRLSIRGRTTISQ